MKRGQHLTSSTVEAARVFAMRVATAGLACAALAAGARGASPRPPQAGGTPATNTPFVVVLGTAQDGGVPQIGGRAPEDDAARQDPKRRRLVASLLIVDPVSRERFLIDATPDLPTQVDAADRVAPRPVPATGRPPLFDAIALTHAHVGHYAGLIHLGREAYGALSQRVLASERMTRFLETNGPWDLLVKAKHVAIDRLTPDTRFPLNARLALIPLLVPHRDEYSDTFGFVIVGPTRRILWLPDIDKWEKWDRRIEDLIASVDIAYVDGTFFDGDELPGRAMSEVPHPFIVESLARFGALHANERAKIVFVHLNHTNAAFTPGSRARRAIDSAGMRVAAEGERRPL
jgi:pyrroloquinoline quinone biosynthesis protein B